MFWKDVSEGNGGRVESCSRIKYGIGRLVLGEDEVQRILMDYLEGLYNK